MREQLQQLRIPGPTPVPPAVTMAASKPIFNHRGATFHSLYADVVERLKRVFGTEGDICLLTGSGTAAMEAAVVNCVSPGDRVLVLVGGVFGNRWAQIARAFGAEVVEWHYDWNEGAEPEQLAAKLQADPDIKVVFATHNESSTGVLNDIEGLSRARGDGRDKHEVLLIVDSVSGVGGAPLPMDEWGVDVVVTGSQKCLMVPPGLAFVALGERAAARVEETTNNRYYFDLRTYLRAGEGNETPFTPAVSLVAALQEALTMLERDGLDAAFDRHMLMRNMTRAAMRTLGLQLYTTERWASPTVTAVLAPEGVDVTAFRKLVREQFYVELAGGQGELKDRLFRIGHMGFAGPLDVMAAVAAIEQGLGAVGQEVDFGRGSDAAQEVWASWD